MNEDLRKMLESAREASRRLNRCQEADINRLLLSAADKVEAAIDKILAANATDLARMDKDNPKYDRLKLTPDRIRAIAADMRSVASLPSPLRRTLAEWTQPNGMRIRKVSVPFGVVGVIYEARPNVTFDVFSILMKSGNACVLKGGSDADASNRAAVDVLRESLLAEGFDEHSVTLLPPDHEATQEMLQAVGYVDLVIPRGSSRLIRFVRDNARVPVIETGAGVCHCYFDASGDLQKGSAIVSNAKTRRVSVCNALDCLLIDRARLSDLPALVAPMAAKHVVVGADEEAYAALEGKYPHLEHADDSDWGKEYLDYKMSVRTVDGLGGALDHIARHTSHHSRGCRRLPRVLTGGRRSVCLHQPSHGVYRRRSVRLWRRDRYLDAETACPRPYGAARDDHLQICNLRRRADARLKKEACGAVIDMHPRLR